MRNLLHYCIIAAYVAIIIILHAPVILIVSAKIKQCHCVHGGGVVWVWDDSSGQCLCGGIVHVYRPSVGGG